VSGRQVAWVSGVAVVLGAVNSALINELHGGWLWWVAALVVTVLGAVVAAFLAQTSSVPGGSVEVGAGGVFVGQDNAGQINTVGGQPAGRIGRRVWRRIGPGGVFVGGDNHRGGVIDTAGGPVKKPGDRG
jgi:hypothetical protein